MRGKVAVCQPPAEFEPNMGWALEDMIVYARVLDPDTFASEEYITEERIGNPNRILEAKQHLYTRLFFRIIDDNYNRPEKTDFDSYARRWRGKAKINKTVQQTANA